MILNNLTVICGLCQCAAFSSLDVKPIRDSLSHMDISTAAIAAQLATTRQNAAMGMIKSNANADKAIADMLMQTIENAPTSGGRGSLVNITV
jgi:hypothetical protein